MSKATVVRKKALDLVRQQDWQGAIREYKRLVEMDQSNPNVHNELADIYLKTSAKAEAYDCFVRAIDEYTRVGLYNNAVAVAKKVMRVLPARTEVLTLLGNVRMKQGLTREAESYYNSFLEKVAGSAVDAPAFKKIAHEIAEAVPESVPVLHRLSQCLLSFQLDEDAGDILVKLYGLVQRNGNAALLEEVRASVERLGLGARIAVMPGETPAPAAAAGAPAAGRTVVTEQNIWTQSHSAGERIEIESTPHFTPPGAPAAPGNAKAPEAKPAPAAPAPPATPASPGAPSGEAAPAAADGPSEKELYLLRLARGVGGTSPVPRVKKEKKEAPRPGAKYAKPAAEPAPVAEEPVAAVEEQAPAAEEKGHVAEEHVAAEQTAGAQASAAASASAENADEAPPAEQPTATATMPRPAPAKPEPAPAKPEPTQAKPAPAPARPASRPAGDHTQISALIGNDFGGEEGEDDYRSHYDLGMAYMEMDLLSEAIREYQAASKSPQFQVKCLEMIGLCLVRQNLPQLAIKQLSKGLAIIGDDGEESLGMKYNLGLAYEMVGDIAAARAQFEDVYVVDVTFRDVAEKIARLADRS